MKYPSSSSKENPIISLNEIWFFWEKLIISMFEGDEKIA
jgi:hypothetical protein